MADNQASVGPHPEVTKSGKGRLMPIVIVALLMIGEGIGIFFLANAMRAEPVPAVAAAGTGSGGEAGGAMPEDLAEVELAECKPANKQLGKLITFQIRVSALVASTDVEHVQALVEAKEARIRDRVNFVVRSADPKHLDEPGLETIKRRLKAELDRVLEDEGVIKEVLIPELLQSRGGL